MIMSTVDDRAIVVEGGFGLNSLKSDDEMIRLTLGSRGIDLH